MKAQLPLFDIDKAVAQVEQMGMRRWLERTLTIAYFEARKGKLRTYDQHEFEVNWIRNIAALRDAILEEEYEPGASKAFVIFDPMVREIFAAKFRDRVVHHMLYKMQAPWWDRFFIEDSYSCRNGKGTHYGIRRAQKMMCDSIRVAAEEAKEAGHPTSDWRTKEFCPHIIKLDISGYFMSLPRDKVNRRVQWGLSQQFEGYRDNKIAFSIYKMCKFLWEQVIFDDPASKAIKCGDLNHWNPEILPKRKSLFCQPPGYGLVIGNLTSQLCSNIYLDYLDKFVTEELGYKHYGRYVDDFFFITGGGEAYERGKRDVKEIERFLAKGMELKLHPKKRYYQDVPKGMEFIGARVYPYCRYPSNRLQGKAKDGFRRFIAGQNEFESIQSYIGMMSQLDGEKFLDETFGEVGW